MTQPLGIIIVEKNSSLKSLSIKDFKPEELFKKCGFKKGENFIKQVEWNVKIDGKKYFVEVFAKTEGRHNSENKYDFPPPIDTSLFFGSCAILTFFLKNDGEKIYTDLNLILWNKIYEKLFGGFEDLSSTYVEDEHEEDELKKLPSDKKTKQGYLKDGFVIDTSDSDETSSYLSTEEEDDDKSEEQNSVDELNIEDLTSELSEELYEYDEDDK
jgi:hypothetical protein